MFELRNKPYNLIPYFQNLFPVRGRKLFSEVLHESAIAVLLSKPLPRKGTETLCRFPRCLLQPRLSKPLPRKGTETLDAQRPA